MQVLTTPKSSFRVTLGLRTVEFNLFLQEDDENVMLISKKAITINLPLKNIPVLSRNTKGVILMRLKSGDDKERLELTNPLWKEDTKKVLHKKKRSGK